jgi:hypothetical protein
VSLCAMSGCMNEATVKDVGTPGYCQSCVTKKLGEFVKSGETP